MNFFKDSSITRQQGFIVLAAALVIVYLLWNVAALDFLAYPLRLFVTYVHEAGHSSMALITGGEVVGFRVYSNGSGVASTAGGAGWLILPAGYLGAAFFGAILFYLVNTTRRPRTIAILVGIGLIIFSILYTIPGDGQFLALVIGLVGGIMLILLGWKGSPTVSLLVLNVLAIMTALNAVLDIVSLVSNSDIAMKASDGSIMVRNDAYAFAETMGGVVPAWLWALTWAGLAIFMVGLSVYFSLLRPMLRGAGTAISAQAENLSSFNPRRRKN